MPQRGARATLATLRWREEKEDAEDACSFRTGENKRSKSERLIRRGERNKNILFILRCTPFHGEDEAEKSERARQKRGRLERLLEDDSLYLKMVAEYRVSSSLLRRASVGGAVRRGFSNRYDEKGDGQRARGKRRRDLENDSCLRKRGLSCFSSHGTLYTVPKVPLDLGQVRPLVRSNSGLFGTRSS